MKTNRTALLAILQAVKPGLAGKEVVEQSTAVIFSQGDVLTYNDEVAVRHPLPNDLQLEGAVQAKELFALLNKLTDDEIRLEMTETELLISGKKTKAGVRRQATTTGTETIRVLGEPSDWTPLPKKFLEAVKFCLFSTSRDMTKPLLTCVCIDGKHVFGSDNRRISRFNMNDAEGVTDLGMPAGEQLLIPAGSAKALLDYPIIEFDCTKGWLHFRTGSGVVFSCRDMEGNFPTEKIATILDQADGERVTLPTGLQDTLERAGVFAPSSGGRTDSGDRVRMELRDGLLSVRGENESGWLEEQTCVRYKGPNVGFDVSADFLQSILKHCREMCVGKNQLTFEGPDFIHVMAILAKS